MTICWYIIATDLHNILYPALCGHRLHAVHREPAAARAGAGGAVAAGLPDRAALALLRAAGGGLGPPPHREHHVQEGRLLQPQEVGL